MMPAIRRTGQCSYCRCDVAGRLTRLDIGRCNDPWAPMPSQAVPLVAHCSSLRALALWQLPAESSALGEPPAKDFVTDAMVAATVAQLPHLEARPTAPALVCMWDAFV